MALRGIDDPAYNSTQQPQKRNNCYQPSLEMSPRYAAESSFAINDSFNASLLIEGHHSADFSRAFFILANIGLYVIYFVCLFECK